MLKNFSIFDPMTLQEDGDEVLDEDQIESLEVGTCNIETINTPLFYYVCTEHHYILLCLIIDECRMQT